MGVDVGFDAVVFENSVTSGLSELCGPFGVFQESCRPFGELGSVTDGDEVTGDSVLDQFGVGGDIAGDDG